MKTLHHRTERGSALLDTRMPLRLAWAGTSLMLALSLGGCLAFSHGVASVRGAAPQQELVIELPPVDLPVAAEHHDVPQPEPYWTIFPTDAWLHGFSLEVLDSRGDSVPRSVMHHLKLMMPRERELFMPIMLRLLGAGAETRNGRLPHSLGIPIQAGDSLLATAMFHNPTGRAHEGVRIRVRIAYSSAPAAAPATLVRPFFLHVTPPDESSAYDLPPGRSERSWEASPAVAGRILGLGGHMHRYGTELRLEDVATGRVLWRTRPRLDEQGHVLEIPRKVYVWRRGILLRPDRTYRVTAVYDNPTGSTIPEGGMGTLGGIIALARPCPEPDPLDRLYVLDRLRETVAGSGSHHHHVEHD